MNQQARNQRLLRHMPAAQTDRALESSGYVAWRLRSEVTFPLALGTAALSTLSHVPGVGAATPMVPWGMGSMDGGDDLRTKSKRTVLLGNQHLSALTGR